MKLQKKFITMEVKAIAANEFVVEFRFKKGVMLVVRLSENNVMKTLAANSNDVGIIPAFVFFDSEEAKDAFYDAIAYPTKIDRYGYAYILAVSLICRPGQALSEDLLYLSSDELRECYNIGINQASDAWSLMDLIHNLKIGSPNDSVMQCASLMYNIEKTKDIATIFCGDNKSHLSQLKLLGDDKLATLPSLTTSAQIKSYTSNNTVSPLQRDLLNEYITGGGKLNTYPILRHNADEGNDYVFHTGALTSQDGFRVNSDTVETALKTVFGTIGFIPPEINIDTHLSEHLNSHNMSISDTAIRWNLPNTKQHDYLPISFNSLASLYDKIFDSELCSVILSRITYDTITVSKSALVRLFYLNKAKADLGEVKLYQIHKEQYINILNALADLPSDFVYRE